MIIGILASDIKGNIGHNGELLLKISEDLKRFKTLTSGNIVLMGRKTFDSIGRPLPNRQNIVITRKKELFLKKYETYNSELLVYSEIDVNHLEQLGKYNDVYIIGGAEIYKLLLPYCDRIELTQINFDFGDCDSKVSNILEILSLFKEVKRESINIQDGIEYQYITYEK